MADNDAVNVFIESHSCLYNDGLNTEDEQCDTNSDNSSSGEAPEAWKSLMIEKMTEVEVEDWDSEEYWEPCSRVVYLEPTKSWEYYLRKKMEDGNFCPKDYHQEPVEARIQFTKSFNVSEGQFDDCSDEELK